MLPFGIVESLPDKNGTESQNLISNFRVEFFSEYNTFGGREMSTTGSATNGAVFSSSLSFVDTTEATGDLIPSRCIGLAGIVGFDFIAVVVFRRKFGIVLAINGIVVCSVGCSFPLNAFLRNASRKFGFFGAGSWVCPEEKLA